MILAIIGIISLVWGIYDLRKDKTARTGKSVTNRFQSWAQIIAGAIALLYSFLHGIR